MNSVILKFINEDQVICFNLGWGDKAVKHDDEEEENGNNEKE